jgi:hypothetical protein
MARHYGQHAVCTLCDGTARRNSEAGRAEARRRSMAAARARNMALTMGLPQSVADRAGSYATNPGVTTRAAIEQAIGAAADAAAGRR